MKYSIRKYSRFITGSKYVLFVNILDRIFFFLFYLLIAREYSTASYGEAITLSALSTVFVTLFDIGLPHYLQRELSISRIGASELFSKLFFINLLLFFIYFLLLFLTYKLLFPQIQFLLFVVIAVMIYESSFLNLCNKALSGINDFRSQFIAMCISRIYVLAFAFLAVRSFKFDLPSIFLILLGGFFLQIVVLLWFMDKKGIPLTFNFFSLKNSASIIRLSLPLGIAVIFNFLYDKIDILLISKLMNFTQAAYYNVAYGLFKASTLSFSFIFVTGFTRVSKLSRSKKAVKLFLLKYVKITLVISVTVCLIVLLLSDIIVKSFYTDKFTDSIVILRILSPAIIAFGCNSLTGIILNGIGLFKVVMYITLFGLIINFILNILFIPIYGIKASAWISVITEYSIFILELYYLAKVLNLRLKIINS